MKFKSNIPNLFTFFNLALGILSIIYIFKQNYYVSALLILLAALFDRFDGKLARKFNAASDLGKELDSLCDLISFGVAPSILMWNINLIHIGIIGIIITILFAVSGAYRLARYNTIDFEGVYLGLPITLSGGLVALASLYTIRYRTNIYIIVFFMVMLSYLMISTKFKLKKR
jgi:CDP-diacylglycerol--serine O-phosphatidyltransferase